MNVYKSKDIAKATGLSESNLRDICLKKGLPKNKNKYVFPMDIWRSILLKKHRKALNNLEPNIKSINKKFPEVIYVTRTIEIYESKINFMK